MHHQTFGYNSKLSLLQSGKHTRPYHTLSINPLTPFHYIPSIFQNQRWSVRNFVQQCELSTPRDYYGEILAKAATNVNSSPLRLEENLVPLGAGILRDYYLKSLEVVQKDAEARSAEQIHNDNELARQLEEERQRELLRLRQLEEEDAKLAQSLAGTDQRNLNSSSSSSSSSSDNRRKDSNRTSLSGARTTSASSSSSSSGARRSSKPQNNGSSLLTFFAKDEGGGSSSSSSSSSSSQSSLNNCNSSPAGINENQYPTGTQSSNNECQHQPSSSSGKKRPIDSDPDVILVERSNSNSDSNSIPKSKEQKPLQQVALPENHSHNKRSKQQDKLEQNWVCTKCTFADNPALYLFCDCCSEERQSTNTSSTSSSSSSSSQENISHLAF